MEKKAHFKIQGPAGTIADVDVLDPKITGFPKERIRIVNYNPYFPGNPYLEKDVAWNPDHAAYGSGSFRIEKDDGTVVVVSPILFSDKNVYKNHFSGLEHWNTEFWWYKEGETPRRVCRIPGTDMHRFGKTRYLEIIASGTDFPTFKIRLEWKV